MLSKSQLKDLGRYALKKRRDEEGVFVAEGGKLIEELSRTYTCKLLVGTEKLGNQPSIPCEKIPACNPRRVRPYYSAKNST